MTWRMWLLACLSLSMAACITKRQVEVVELPATEPTVVRSPVKAHLLDGSVVLFPDGVTVTAESLRGVGSRYDLAAQFAGDVERVPLDSVAGMESFRTGVNVPMTVALSVPATALGLVGSVALFKAIFGSCPTFYSDSAGIFALEAEGFSYSIAPLFENRDVDRLNLQADTLGRVRLEVRNEALETHYLNHLELLEVAQRPDELVLPSHRAQPLAVRELLPPSHAHDRAGRDLQRVLATTDGEVFQTAPATLAAVAVEDLDDHIDLSFPAPLADSAAVVLRLRNSLLTTVLLYEMMLGSAASLDWLGRDLEQVGGALELGRWYARRMGLKISVREAGAYREVARVADSGPIAWKDVAAVVPVPPGDSLHLRLSFVADEWRIDRIALATEVRRPEVRVVRAAGVTGADGRPDSAVLGHLSDPDQRYLQTSPGQRFTLHFETGAPAPGMGRSFLLASQGYYSEWVRRDWLRPPRAAHAFRPSDEALLAALERWRSRQGVLEAEFFNSRIPVR